MHYTGPVVRPPHEIGILIKSYLPKANSALKDSLIKELEDTIKKFTNKDERSLRRYRESLKNI